MAEEWCWFVSWARDITSRKFRSPDRGGPNYMHGPLSMQVCIFSFLVNGIMSQKCPTTIASRWRSKEISAKGTNRLSSFLSRQSPIGPSRRWATGETRAVGDWWRSGIDATNGTVAVLTLKKARREITPISPPGTENCSSFQMLLRWCHKISKNSDPAEDCTCPTRDIVSIPCWMLAWRVDFSSFTIRSIIDAKERVIRTDWLLPTATISPTFLKDGIIETFRKKIMFRNNVVFT
jgi:hypothetical protein